MQRSNALPATPAAQPHATFCSIGTKFDGNLCADLSEAPQGPPNVLFQMERNYSNSNLQSMASDSSYAQDAWLEVVVVGCRDGRGSAENVDYLMRGHRLKSRALDP